ncbi:MAG: hypothetical protein IPG80_01020 [Anaerolineales bacterium]|jgi:hypothetical protein|uniref:hypothetical protein n=1 Tax=Candidatus Villigracilis vicinus TaxID=3140679 RepID=UPI003135FCBB|nr:hypothetical protein [Anaerolineales bacterium]MBK9782197.1 hypothetical protein [Anaerolineales bacterium]
MKQIVWRSSHWLGTSITLKRLSLHIALFCWVSLLSLLINACDAVTTTPYAANDSLLMSTQVLITEPPCEACAQATLAVILTKEKGNADFQAAATAEILRVNAQATLNSAVATLSAAQTQEQNNSNVIAAQIAATAEIVRANAQATLNSAGSTQIAAMTQAQYNLQATDSARTQGVIAMQTQQNKDDLAAGTQTAIANTIATQTQSAAATSQWYADQERQRDEEWRGSMTLFWIWCPLVFFVALTVSALWGFRRWLNIQQTNQRILENTVKRLPEAAVEVEPYTYIDSDVLDEGGYQVTTPEDKVHQWLDEVKDELSNSDEKEENNDQRN